MHRERSHEPDFSLPLRDHERQQPRLARLAQTQPAALPLSSLVLDYHWSVPVRFLAFLNRDTMAGYVIHVCGVPIELHSLLQRTYDWDAFATGNGISIVGDGRFR